jgi:hypothetical protein
VTRRIPSSMPSMSASRSRSCCLGIIFDIRHRFPQITTNSNIQRTIQCTIPLGSISITDFFPPKRGVEFNLNPPKRGVEFNLNPPKRGPMQATKCNLEANPEYRNALHYYLYEMKSKLSCFWYARIQNVIGRLTTTLVSLGWRNSESLIIHPRLHFHTAPPIPSVYTNCFGS